MRRFVSFIVCFASEAGASHHHARLQSTVVRGGPIAAIAPPPPVASQLTHTSFERIEFAEGMDVLASAGCKDRRDVLGVKPMLSSELTQRILTELSRPDFAWTTARHSLYPTTDCEVHAVPWLEAEMAHVLEGSLLPAIARLFRVDEDSLFLRDQFVVKYSSAAGCQRGLETHYDESCFSYVIQLNDPCHFSGGGTLFDHADAPMTVPPGNALLFCGYNRHMGVPVIEGERYVLTGFVDFRSDTDSVRRFYGQSMGQKPDELPRPYGAGSNDFPSPHLTVNNERLERAYGGKRGEALLRAIAYSPPALGAHVDLSRLRERCAGWLESGHVPNERFYSFLQAHIGTGSRSQDDETESVE